MWILTTAGALILVMVAMIAAAYVYRGDVGDLLIVDRGRPFLLSMVVIVGADLLLVGLLLIALRGVTLDPPRPAGSGDEARYFEYGVSGRVCASPSITMSTRSL